jgi:hypothetical protein
MTAARRLVLLVLCALLALGDAPVRATAGCSGATAAREPAPAAPRGCCTSGACCCGGPQSCSMAGCRSGERRAPAPRLPAGRTLQLALPDARAPRPQRAGDDSTCDRADAPPPASAPRAFRALPARLRQEALSVWRC